ncbi:MAG: adenylyltransferase/cytidyltransferase family protein [Candidatus Paceibacterota bacterium]|jgi:D-beta-D-heptose 7-phosphate kinase/D-beta-D-heptose 1-phosphate adenosyltransferase
MKSRNAPIVTTLEELNSVVKCQRMLGQTIVLTMGSWNIFHPGHGKYIERASEQADYLIVGVDNDAKIKKKKGDTRPIIPQDERMDTISRIRHVGLVVLKEEAPKWEMIKIVKPDVLIATQETYSNEDLEKLKEFCGEVKVLEPQATTHTSNKIRLMVMNLVKDIRQKLIPGLNEYVENFFANEMGTKKEGEVPK